MTGTKRRKYHEDAFKAVSGIENDGGEIGEPDNPNHQRLSASRIMRFCHPNLQEETEPRFVDRDRLRHSKMTMPLFGDSTNYGIRSETQERLWDLEIKRLLQVATSDQTETLLPELKPGQKGLLQSPVNNESLDKLRNLADKVLYSLHACMIDDDSILSNEIPDRAHRAHQAYRTLQQEFGEKYTLPGQHSQSEAVGVHSFEYDNGNYDSSDGSDEKHGTNKDDNNDKDSNQEVNKGQGRTILESKQEKSNKFQRNAPLNVKKMKETDIGQYYYLVDQITSTLARLAVLGSNSSYWHVIVLACLAKLSTKMKLLATNLADSIQNCLRKHQVEYESGTLSIVDPPGRYATTTLDDNSPTAYRYCGEFESASVWVAECFTQVLTSLGAQKPWRTHSHHVDISALIYSVGVAGTRTLLYQNRRGAISGSSTLIPMAFSMNGLRMVKKIGTALSSQYDCSVAHSTVQMRDTEDKVTVTLIIEMEETLGEKICHERQSLQLRSIIDLVTTLIPLSLSQPELGRGFQQSLQTISALSAFEKPKFDETEERTYTGFINLKTNGTGDDEDGTDSSSLSSSFMARIRHNILGRRPTDSKLADLKESQIEEALTEAKRKRERLKEICNKWAIQETSIVIRCPAYVHGILLFSGSLVLGGLLCGFLVGERIPGVDPFNLTMFSWIIGGFAILIAKSVRVSDWTWRDFLMRQVACRTVKEVSSVTGLDPQDVLVFLLSTEMHSPLRTCGPYSGSFFFDSSAATFSIDIKPTLQTLLASGIIPVVVLTLSGPAVIELRLAPGFSNIEFQSVSASGRREDATACMDLPKPGGKTQNANFIRCGVTWFKVLGMYNSAGVNFQ